MKFTTKKITRRLTLGERLKRARRRKKLSIEELEAITKIKSNYIAALESDNYKVLPSEVYIKGFLQTLASYLGFDPADILHHYRRQRGEKLKKKKIRFFKGVKLRRFVLTTRGLLIGLLVLFLLGLGGYLWYQVSGFAATPKLTIDEPSTTDLVTKDETLKIAGRTDPGASVAINSQPINVDLEGKFAEKVELKSGLNNIEIVSHNKIGRERKVLLSILANFQETNLAQGEVAGATSGLSLTLEISPDPCWLSIEADGENLFQGVMLAKTKRNFAAKKEINITSANAGSVHLYLNGEDLGLMGEPGERKSIKLTTANLKASQ